MDGNKLRMNRLKLARELSEEGEGRFWLKAVRACLALVSGSSHLWISVWPDKD
jgi:hypothetical protein